MKATKLVCTPKYRCSCNCSRGNLTASLLGPKSYFIKLCSSDAWLTVYSLTEEHWEEDKEKFEGDFQGRNEYRDEERREYRGSEYDRGGGDQYYSETTVVHDEGYGGDSGYRRDEYRDDSYVDDAARWTGNKVGSARAV